MATNLTTQIIDGFLSVYGGKRSCSMLSVNYIISSAESTRLWSGQRRPR